MTFTFAHGFVCFSVCVCVSVGLSLVLSLATGKAQLPAVVAAQTVELIDNEGPGQRNSGCQLLLIQGFRSDFPVPDTCCQFAIASVQVENL